MNPHEIVVHEMKAYGGLWGNRMEVLPSIPGADLRFAISRRLGD